MTNETFLRGSTWEAYILVAVSFVTDSQGSEWSAFPSKFTSNSNRRKEKRIDTKDTTLLSTLPQDAASNIENDNVVRSSHETETPTKLNKLHVEE